MRALKWKITQRVGHLKKRPYQAVLVVVIVTYLSLMMAILINIMPSKDFNFVMWFYSTIIQLNGAILGVIIVILSLSVVVLPKKVIVLFKEFHFDYLELTILLLIITILISFIGLSYGTNSRNTGIYFAAFLFEGISICVLGLFLLELARKFNTILRYYIEETRTDEVINNIKLRIENKNLILSSPEYLLHFVEGVFQISLFEEDESVAKPIGESKWEELSNKGLIDEEGIPLVSFPECFEKLKSGMILWLNGVFKLVDVQGRAYHIHVEATIQYKKHQLKLRGLSVQYLPEEQYKMVKEQRIIIM
ncbi:hypothetical protein JCM16138_04840 [Thermococcus atlanticus]